MKNVLFATSALVGIAGVAFAEGHTGVALSGSAEMGITYFDDGTDDSTEFHNDIDVTFTLSGATDNGLTFGASIDLDEADGDAVIESSNSVFISGSFGTLSMGDVDGAYDKALSNVPNGGLNGEADHTSGTSGLDGYSDGEILRYDYSFSGLTVSASLELEDEASGVENIYGVGVAYSGDAGSISYNVGLGYQTTEDSDGAGNGADAYGVSAVVGFGDFAVTGVYERLEVDGSDDTDTYGLGAEYTMGAITVAGAYQRSESGGFNEDIYQAYMTYDLTGGAEIVAAVGFIDDNAGTEETYAGFGLGFSF